MNDKSRLDRDTTDSYDPNEGQYFSYIFDSSDEYLWRKLQQEAANDEPLPSDVSQTDGREDQKRTETFKICKYV